MVVEIYYSFILFIFQLIRKNGFVDQNTN